jgi:hypothetical protein
VERPADGLGMSRRPAPGLKKFDLTRALEGTDLEIGQVVPSAPMVDAASGAPVSLWDLRQNFAAAVCFLHSGCRACLLFAQNLRVFAGELLDLDAIAVAVVPKGIDLEPPVWVDREGLARDRLLSPDAPLPTVLIVDRYGAAAGSFPSRGHSFPPPEEVVATLRHLAMECPECGVSEW